MVYFIESQQHRMSAFDGITRPLEEEDIDDTVDGDALSGVDSCETRSIAYLPGDQIPYDVSSPPMFTARPIKTVQPNIPMPPYASHPHKPHHAYGPPPSMYPPGMYGYPSPYPSTYSAPLPSSPYNSFPYSACSCPDCTGYSTYPTPQPVAAPPVPAPSKPAVMCCYHKRGVCKKGIDCWYSHNGSPDTPCHYGVKCVAGHGLLSRTALDPHAASGNKIPAWARHPFKHTHEPHKEMQERAHYSKKGPMMASAVPPPPSLPRSLPAAQLPKNGEKVTNPPSLDNVECKFCGNHQLYVMPYRLYATNTSSTLQYRVHCMSCQGSWTPSSSELPPAQHERQPPVDEQP
jgi:hypothetical protein